LDSYTRAIGLWLLRWLLRPRMRLFCPFLMICLFATLHFGGFNPAKPQKSPLDQRRGGEPRLRPLSRSQ
jgi:hypothetical protein